MATMLVSLIVAVANNGVIGKQGKLPWHLPADLRYFQRVTMGHHVIMGRTTYESIDPKFRPLRGRVNVVLSRDPSYRQRGCIAAHTIDEALAIARAAAESEAFVAGGAQVYRAALALADRVYLTRVDASVDGEAVFPALDATEWVESSRRVHEADENNAFRCTFLVCERARPT
jgi:dihydrofolate reductase